MKRKEEREQFAADSVKGADKLYGYKYSIKDVESAIIDGAEWADKTMIDRVCEFIKKKFTETIVGNVISRHETTINEVINDLRKEMEGE